MMTSRQRVIKTLRHEEVDRLPRHLWTLPGIHMFRGAEYAQVASQFPDDIAYPEFHYGKGNRCTGNAYSALEYVDDWGSLWKAGEPGVVGEVKRYPLEDWSALETYQLPWEILDNADFSKVDESCRSSDKFILGGTDIRPFERMQFLRGTENLLMDLVCGEPEVYRLRDMLHAFYTKEIRVWATTQVDAVAFMDDWGSQQSLLISPTLWREFYKPLYKEYCDILHAAGKFAFFHSDGNIEMIYDDLVEIGIDAVNSQLFCMDMEEIGRKYAGEITFWGEIDRQYILPFGTPQEARNAVQRAAKALLKEKRTGVIAQCEWGTKDPKENIAAVFETWNTI